MGTPLEVRVVVVIMRLPLRAKDKERDEGHYKSKTDNSPDYSPNSCGRIVNCGTPGGRWWA